MSAYLEVPIGELKVADDNVRQKVGDVSELAESIKAGGVLQPLLVNEADMVVVAGARRLAAAKKARLTVVPVVKRAFSEQERLEAMIVENLQREDLTPLEEATGFKRLAEMGLSQRTIAAQVGRSQGHVAKRLSLLALPEAVQKKVDSGGITLPDAQELAKLKDDPKAVEKLAEQGKSAYGASISSQVERELKKKAQEKKRADAAAALVKKGETVIETKTDEWGYRVTLPEGVKEVRKEAFTAEYVEMPPSKHAKLECHAVYVDPRELKPVECCTKPDNHPSKADKLKAERAKAAAAAKKAQEAFKQMTDRRRQFVVDQIKARVDKDALIELAYLALTDETHYYGSADEYVLAFDLLGLEKPGPEVAGASEIEWDMLLDVEAAKSATARCRVTLAFAAAKFEIKLDRDGSWYGMKPYFAWLAKRGYKPSDYEKEMVDDD